MIKIPFKKVKHIRSTSKQKYHSLKKAKKFINKNTSTYSKNKLKRVLKKADKGKDTQNKYSNKGKYTAKRSRIHQRIIKKTLSQDRSSKDPDLYIMGGVPGSQKSTAVRGFIRERAVMINNDDIKSDLAKHNQSPVKKYPLMHGTLLHEESSDVEEKIIMRARRQRKDVILDRTMKNWKKNKKLVEKFRKVGYDIHVYGTNLKPHKAVHRVAYRYVTEGRYVPPENITRYGNQTNQNVLRMAKKKFVESAVIVNTGSCKPDRKCKPRVIYRKTNFERRE